MNVTTFGLLTFKDDYNSQVSHQNLVSWGKLVWILIIPPVKSLVLWRIVQNVITTKDNLAKGGFP